MSTNPSMFNIDRCSAKVDRLPFLVEIDRYFLKIDRCLVKIAGLNKKPEFWHKRHPIPFDVINIYLKGALFREILHLSTFETTSSSTVVEPFIDVWTPNALVFTIAWPYHIKCQCVLQTLRCMGGCQCHWAIVYTTINTLIKAPLKRMRPYDRKLIFLALLWGAVCVKTLVFNSNCDLY